MSLLDQIYRLEVEFHRQFRLQSLHAAELWSVHTSYALQNGYEAMLRSLGTVDPAALARAKERMTPQCDPRDVQAAYASLRQLVAAT